MKKLKNRAYNWLRWSEKYTKTDMVYLARGGFWLTLGQGVASLSSFALAIAFANLLPKETYGTYKYILSIGSVLAIFTLTGMGTAVTQATARGLGSIIKPAFQTKLRWGLVGSFGSILGAIYYYTHANHTLAIGLLIISIFMPFMEAFGIYDSFLQGRKRFDISTKYFVIGQITSVAISIITLLLTSNVLWLTLAYFVSWTIVRGIFFKKTSRSEGGESTETTPSLSYGKHLSLIGVLGMVSAYADRILIFHYVGAAEAAVYSIAIAMPEQIKGVFKNIGSLALPKFSQNNIPDIQNDIRGKMLKMGLMVLPAIAGYIILAPIIFKLIFPQYVDAVIYSQIYALSLFIVINILPGAVLTGQAAKKELYIINLSINTLEIILMFVFVYKYGVMGIIVSKLITKLLNTILSYTLLMRIKPQEI